MGTQAWKNWRAFDSALAERENYDDEFQSDRFFVGGPISLGPYSLSIVIRDEGSVGPAVILTSGLHADLAPQIVVDGELAKANSDAYHGGTIGDEIAALISLELGVRLRLAGTLRLSGLGTSGAPRNSLRFETPRLARPGLTGRETIPRALRREANIDLLSRLRSLPRLSSDAEIELVRAARSYASGIWWANEDPNQAWLSFVTALEIAAKYRRHAAGASDGDMVAEHWPKLWEVLEPESESVRNAVTKEVAPLMKSTRAFVQLVADLAPGPPEARPTYAQLDWTQMRKHASLVYNHRSVFLHAGKPFPPPMLESPGRDESGVEQEVPWGLNTGALGGIWDAKETPMLLSTFEYVCRGALLNWWDELIETSTSR